MEFDVLDWKKSEMVFVVCVLTVIFGVSFYQLRIGEMKTRDAQRKADVELVARALNAYYSDYEKYPDMKDGKIVSCGEKGLDVCEWGGGPIVDEKNVIYLKKIPVDPRNWWYVYELREGGFRIYVGLEYSGDPGMRKDLTMECGNHVQCKWYATN